MDISGYALITGAASGIGRATALSLAAEGAKGLALVDLNIDALNSVKAEIEAAHEERTSKSSSSSSSPAASSSTSKIEIITSVLDVTNEANVISTVNTIKETFGRIDYVVNSAGIGLPNPGGMVSTETKNWHKVLDVNLTGTFFVMREAVRIMLGQDEILSVVNGRKLQKGAIVNVASILGLVGTTRATAYVASKHAVVGLTKTASEDHAAQGIKINACCPGYIETPLTTATEEQAVRTRAHVEANTTLRRWGTPEEVADAILFLCGGRSSFVAGSTLVVDGGFTSH